MSDERRGAQESEADREPAGTQGSATAGECRAADDRPSDEDSTFRRVLELVAANRYPLSPQKIALAILERSAPEVYAILRAAGEADE